MEILNNHTNSEKFKIRIIRLNEVKNRTGYGRTSIYRKIEEGTFPKFLKLGGPLKDPDTFDSRAIGWLEHEVDQWLESNY
jgi:prophage regulatory protein|tara:strand:+ start:259 stop:498 length:240 start_codon:yes stop_codon:yes gene_type:complete